MQCNIFEYCKIAHENGSWLLIIWEKGTFSFGQLFPVLAGTWFRLRSEFFGPKIRIWAGKTVFCYGTPSFVNGVFEALGICYLWIAFEIDFLFPSYGLLREGTRPTRQKVFSHPNCGGTVCQKHS